MRIASSSSSNGITHATGPRSEEHTSELQSQSNLVCRLLLEKKKKPTSVEAATELDHGGQQAQVCTNHSATCRSRALAPLAVWIISNGERLTRSLSRHAIAHD